MSLYYPQKNQELSKTYVHAPHVPAYLSGYTILEEFAWNWIFIEQEIAAK